MSVTRTGATAERLALAARARELYGDGSGLTQAEVAAELGIHRSYVSELIRDPDGSQTRARKDRLGGTCIDCGGPTSGSNGHGLAADRCGDCSRAKQHDDRKWTAEVVIEAIRRFAAEHGRPPTADEWTTADPDHGYPSRSCVYGADFYNPAAPFAKWADAIEAAGFPRPNSGTRSWEATMQNRNGYVVLRENSDGAWELVGERTESSQVLALNAAMNGHKPEGRWLAIPIRYWRPRSLKPRTIFDFVEEPVEA